jgi:hypothetical protein
MICITLKIKKIGSENLSEPTEIELKVVASVRKVLTEELRTNDFKNRGYGAECGHCYHAAQAVYFLLGGSLAGYSGKQATDSECISHWWVCSPTGAILDPTSSQYIDFDRTPPYQKGRSRSFNRYNPNEPTAKAKQVIARVKNGSEVT